MKQNQIIKISDKLTRWFDAKNTKNKDLGPSNFCYCERCDQESDRCECHDANEPSIEDIEASGVSE